MNTRFIILICVTAALTGGLLYSSLSNGNSKHAVSRKVVDAFSRWRLQHGKLYASPAEGGFRLSVFAGQLSYVELKNAEYDRQALDSGVKLSGPMFEMNEFGDLTKIGRASCRERVLMPV